jgi:hypothetical protein
MTVLALFRGFILGVPVMMLLATLGTCFRLMSKVHL